jgi:hypothetical protein
MAGASRAVRRIGELLKEFDGRGKNPGTDVSQKQVAQAAGISNRQRQTAVRVAKVPAADFDTAIETDKPATVTALAAMGRFEGSGTFLRKIWRKKFARMG